MRRSKEAFMTGPSRWFCILAVFCLCFAHAEQSQIEASESTLTHSLKLADAVDGKSAPGFELRDPDLAMINPTCPSPYNCLIRLCNVASNARLTGYCLTGSRGGICHQSYNPMTALKRRSVRFFSASSWAGTMMLKSAAP